MPLTPPAPVPGPAVQWITGDEVAGFCKAAGDALPELYDRVAQEASEVLYEISGRQYPGLQTRTVRPTRDTCQCWSMGDAAGGAGPWFWTASWYGGVGSWGWFNDSNDRLGCQPLSRVRLAGYPVRQIDAVKIDGAAVAELDGAGNPQWRLDEWQWLTRMNDPAVPHVRALWPGCQNLALADTENGTFSITYEWGIDPPPLGKDAAAQLGCLLYQSVNGRTGLLPAGTTKVQRQGVQIERGLIVNWLDPKKPTGLTYLDAFLAAHWRTRAHRKPAVWSPDVQGFARPL